MLTDDQIIESVKNGHIDNFETLIIRYEKKILNFIYKMIMDKDEAENLTQDTFLKVYSNLGKYQSDGKFAPFLFRVAKNLVINHIKRERKNISFSNFFSVHKKEPEIKNGITPLEQLEKKEVDELLKKYISHLKENQRIALIYKFSYDYSYKEIAQLTGWSIPKIETLVHRAKKTLKKNFQCKIFNYKMF